MDTTIQTQSVQVLTPNQASKAVMSLLDARSELVKTAKKTGQVILNYAKALDQTFDLVDNEGNVTTKWFDLKGKLKAGVKAEREIFANEMQKAGFGKPTIDVYWQRVKEASGYVTAGQRVKGSESTDDKTKADLKTIINRIFKAEENGETCASSDFKGQLMDIYESLGGDVDNLG